MNDIVDTQKQWHYVVVSEGETRQEGPVSSQDLESMLSDGRLSTDTLVWSEGMADWAQIGSVPDFSQPVPQDASSPVTESIPVDPSVDRSAADATEPVEASDAVTIKDAGSHTVQFSKSRNVLLVVTNDYHAEPLVLTKLDLLRFLTTMETSAQSCLPSKAG